MSLKQGIAKQERFLVQYLQIQYVIGHAKNSACVYKTLRHNRLFLSIKITYFHSVMNRWTVLHLLKDVRIILQD